MNEAYLDRNVKVDVRRRLTKGRKPAFLENDGMVLKTFEEQRKNKLTVDEDFLKTQAMVAYHQLYPTPSSRPKKFKAIDGWLYRSPELLLLLFRESQRKV